jgi:hypothetical protein
VLVICGKRGQLCNRLFPFANVVALAVDEGVTVVNPGFSEYAPWFTGTAAGSLPRFPSPAGRARGLESRLAYGVAALSLRASRRLRLLPAVSLPDDRALDFDDPGEQLRVRSLLSAPVALLDGLYLLARESFIRNAAVVRRFFAPVPEVARAAASSVEAARDGCVVLVGIHVRQGDYRTHKPSFFHPTERYAGLMNALQRTFAGTRIGFLVCSDSQQDREVFGSLRVRFGSGQPAEDLFALAACDYIAGPPSTFSQWASFYGKVPRYVWVPEDGAPSVPRRDHFVVHEQGYGRFTGPRQIRR